MTSTIITKNSSTASSVPLAASLTAGELAINTADKRLFSKNGSTVFEVGTNPSALTLPNGTANGVPYLNGSKVLTTGSALTFDGTNLINSGALRLTGGASSNVRFEASGSEYARIMGNGSNSLDFAVGGITPNMSLTSTGLGIGTSSPGSLLSLYKYQSDYGIGLYGSAQDWTIKNAYSAGGVLQIASNGGTWLTLNGSGNLGLGVTPSATWSGRNVFQIGISGSLEQGAGQPNQIILGSNRAFNGTQDIYLNNRQATAYQQLNGVHSWSTAPSGTAGNAISFTQAMTLDASNNFMVGTTTSNAKVTIAAPGNSLSALGFTDTQAGGQQYSIGPGVGDSIVNHFGFYSLTNSFFLGYVISNTGAWHQGNNSSTWTVTSDVRVKQNIRSLNNALDKILALKPYHFEYKNKPEQIKTGFIAQDFEQVLPGHVHEDTPSKDLAQYFQEGEKIKSIDTDLIPYLVAAIQEQQALITQQAAAIESLTTRLTALESK